MASVIMSAPTPIDTSPAVTTSSQPRKRRRRAPAAGAADDCFTCSGLGIACDRRRPYCTPCLEDGKDCSGYKTTLTWGVGVASRGKLRGLSLPIAGTAKVASVPTVQSPRKKGSVSSGAPAPKQKRSSPGLHDGRDTTHARTPKTPSISKFNFVKSEPASAAPRPPTSTPWQPSLMTIPTSNPSDLQAMHNMGQMAPPHPLHMPMGNTYDDPNLSASTSSVSGFTDYSFGSPSNMYSASSEDTSYLGNSMPGHRSRMSMSSNDASTYSSHSQNTWTQIHLNSSSEQPPISAAESWSPLIRNDHHVQTAPMFEERSSIKSEHQEGHEVEETVFGNGLTIYDDSAMGTDFEHSFLGDPFSSDSMILSPFSNISIGKTPRMQYLINYYSEVISPVIVAFDGPNNPYRTHILRLAMESETLQHAIAALSASNLRQRRDNHVLTSTGKTLPARRSSMAHSALTDESWQSGVAIMSPEDQAREELLHKSISIQSLNRALADPLRRKDDSILATLLILCLFHICDSGVAKFQTQFAGVKKLLGLRSAELASSNANSASALSKETSWYTRMFTWFDAFTATVNDREGQLQGVHLEISSLSDEEWALENLAGCDGRLFKIIAKLGRLNVLSQNGKVERASPSSRQPQAASYPQHYSHFDGNGWTSMASPSSPLPPTGSMVSPPLPMYDLPVSATKTTTAKPSHVDPSDTRTSQFWTEWTSTRNALLTWSLSPVSPLISPSLSPDQRDDLLNISESFRYSALLYTERLAGPSLPASSPKIQSWVTRSLGFIKLVKSDVYLLWPLFITGSECVREEDRSVIRGRCLDIQKDSGFMNNWSTLELLEKVWARDQHTPTSLALQQQQSLGSKRKASSPAGSTGSNAIESPSSGGVDEDQQGFRWRKVMDIEKNEGEYIVV